MFACEYVLQINVDLTNNIMIEIVSLEITSSSLHKNASYCIIT